MKQLKLGLPVPRATSARNIGEPASDDGTKWQKPKEWEEAVRAPRALVATPKGWHRARILSYMTAKRTKGMWKSEGAHLLLVRDLDTGGEFEVDKLAAIRIPGTGIEPTRRLG